MGAQPTKQEEGAKQPEDMRLRDRKLEDKTAKLDSCELEDKTLHNNSKLEDNAHFEDKISDAKLEDSSELEGKGFDEKVPEDKKVKLGLCKVEPETTRSRRCMAVATRQRESARLVLCSPSPPASARSPDSSLRRPASRRELWARRPPASRAPGGSARDMGQSNVTDGSSNKSTRKQHDTREQQQ
eukprot:4970511-Pyramimonas_sp.AAC.1